MKIIDAQPDAIYAAWQTGDIDAAYVWNPNLAKIKADGGKVLITSADLAEQGTTTYDLAVVANKFATSYPAVVQAWLDAQNRAVTLLQGDPDAAAVDLAAELNISVDEAKSQAADLIFLTADQQAGADYLGGGLPANLWPRRSSTNSSVRSRRSNPSRPTPTPSTRRSPRPPADGDDRHRPRGGTARRGPRLPVPRR